LDSNNQNITIVMYHVLRELITDRVWFN